MFFLIGLIQGCKLLHLAGLSSKEIFIVFTTLVGYTMPFVRILAVAFKSAGNNLSSEDYLVAAKNINNTKAVPAVEILAYSWIASASTVWLKTVLGSTILQWLLWNEPSELQIFCACVSLYCGYGSLLMLLFFPAWRFIRRYYSTLSLPGRFHISLCSTFLL